MPREIDDLYDMLSLVLFFYSYTVERSGMWAGNGNSMEDLERWTERVDARVQELGKSVFFCSCVFFFFFFLTHLFVLVLFFFKFIVFYFWLSDPVRISSLLACDVECMRKVQDLKWDVGHEGSMSVKTNKKNQ